MLRWLSRLRWRKRRGSLTRDRCGGIAVRAFPPPMATEWRTAIGSTSTARNRPVVLLGLFDHTHELLKLSRVGRDLGDGLFFRVGIHQDDLRDLVFRHGSSPPFCRSSRDSLPFSNARTGAVKVFGTLDGCRRIATQKRREKDSLHSTTARGSFRSPKRTDVAACVRQGAWVDAADRPRP